MTEVEKFGQLIDCTEEEFKEYCADKDLGYIHSLHNLMVQTFNQVQEIKNELVQKMSKSEEKSEESISILNGLYSKLLRVEQRVFILREVIKSRELSSQEVPVSGT